MKKVDINFLERRRKVFNLVQDNSLVIIHSSNLVARNADANYPFRQNSDFFYLTGFDEPESCLVLKKVSGVEEFILFCKDRDPLREQWDGLRSGQEGAKKDFGADDAYSIQDLDKILPNTLEGIRTIYYPMVNSNGIDISLNKWLEITRLNARSGSEAPQTIIALESILHEIRLIKSSEEVEVMKIAASITAEAHCNAMKKVTPGMFEYQLEAEYLQTFMKHGSRAAAYNSIVGGGNNACILHYNENKDELKNGDLVLIDAGCEYQNYASDVTRTFPVGGKFTEAQKSIYEVVLNAHSEALKQLIPGNPWIKVHEASVNAITKGLIDLGILDGVMEDLIEQEKFSRFYMHRVGHWLGMDVHDVGNYKVDGEWRALEAGMVLTIEPGIYILDSLEGVDAKWLGIGIRIEDDVLITKDGFEILTSEVPREIEAIEALMHGS